jgi:hypothetical protein
VDDVDPAVALHHGRHELLDRLLARRVEELGGRDAVADQLRRLLRAVQTQVGDDDLRALARQRQRGLAPDARRAAGDERDLAFHSAHDAPLLLGA